MAEAKIARAVRRFLKEVNAEIATGKTSERSFYVVALAETDRIMKEEIDPVFTEMLGL